MDFKLKAPFNPTGDPRPFTLTNESLPSICAYERLRLTLSLNPLVVVRKERGEPTAPNHLL